MTSVLSLFLFRGLDSRPSNNSMAYALTGWSLSGSEISRLEKPPKCHSIELYSNLNSNLNSNAVNGTLAYECSPCVHMSV